MFEGKIWPVVRFLQTCTNCNILKYSLMARERVLESLSRSANGFFFDSSYSIWRGAFSNLFLSFSGLFLYHTLSVRCVDVLAKNMMRSAICWDFTYCRLVVYYNVSGQPLQKSSSQKKIIALLDPWHGTDILSRNVGKRLYHSTPRKIPEDFCLKSRKQYDDLTHKKTNKKLTRRAVYGRCVAALNLLLILMVEIILNLTM